MKKNKIVRLPSKNTDVLNFVEELKEKIETDGIKTLMVACYGSKDNEYVVTGYVNLSNAEKQELLSHFQIDIIDAMIRENYVTPE
jgi:hypothetical protein